MRDGWRPEDWLDYCDMNAERDRADMDAAERRAEQLEDARLTGWEDRELRSEYSVQRLRSRTTV
jgi:hypothetical protein